MTAVKAHDAPGRGSDEHLANQARQRRGARQHQFRQQNATVPSDHHFIEAIVSQKLALTTTRPSLRPRELATCPAVQIDEYSTFRTRISRFIYNVFKCFKLNRVGFIYLL